jgi:hypothetical protein
MDNISSIDLLPPNDRDKVLFNAITPPLDYTINSNIVPIISEIESTYDPSSEHYDPDKVLELLGNKTLINLLSPLIDNTSLSIIITDLMDMKGTIEGFQTLLSLLKIQYKNILFQEQPNGCTDVVLVFNNNQRIDLTTIQDLLKFSSEFFPLCLNLEGIANCSSLISTINNEVIYLGQHKLDINFITDQSKVDSSYGVPLGTTGIILLICNTTYTDLICALSNDYDSVYIHDITNDLNVRIANNTLLDNTLILDGFPPALNDTFSTTLGHLINTDLIINSYSFSSKYYAKYNDLFTLDIDILDTSDFRPLDGYSYYTYCTTALDLSLKLDGGNVLDTSSTTIFNSNSYGYNVTTADVRVHLPTSYSSNYYLNIPNDFKYKQTSTTILNTSLILDSYTPVLNTKFETSIIRDISVDLVNSYNFSSTFYAISQYSFRMNYDTLDSDFRPLDGYPFGYNHYNSNIDSTSVTYNALISVNLSSNIKSVTDSLDLERIYNSEYIPLISF